MTDRKEGQLIFEFDGFTGPGNPALEPEDDSLLDIEEGIGPASFPAEADDDSWEPPAELAGEPSIPEQTVEQVQEDSSQAVDSQAVHETAAQTLQAFAEQPAEPAAEPEPQAEPPPVAAKPAKLLPADLKRASLAWMAQQGPTALASKVPTRLKKFCATVAAFWSEPGRKKRLLKPLRTAIIEVRHDRETCWPESARTSEILPAIREAKERKTLIETEIRRTEPNLKDTDVLFPDFESWDYRSSSNKEYHRCLKRIEELEHSLYKGSRFERIRQARVANELYLAVPEEAVHPHELADGWGLLYIAPDLRAILVKPAEPFDCPEENQMHLAQNVAASSMRDVLFANGVHLSSDGSISIIAPPRRRRPAASSEA